MAVITLPSKDRLIPLAVTLGLSILFYLALVSLRMKWDTRTAGLNLMLEPEADSKSILPSMNKDISEQPAEEQSKIIATSKTVLRVAKPTEQTLTHLMSDYFQKEESKKHVEAKLSSSPANKNNSSFKQGNDSLIPSIKPGAILSNRHLVSILKIIMDEYLPEEGRVVVQITVDREGNVTAARAIGKGSTTVNTILWAKARQTAMQAKFEKWPNGPEEQNGFYVFDFVKK